MKKYKKTLVLTGIITLIPMMIGLLLWNQLPERIATHFGSDGTPNGWSHRGFVVFGLPLFFLAMQVLGMGVTLADPKKNNINEKMIGMMLWFVPVISVLSELYIYGYALGFQKNVITYVSILIGLVFIIVGNYLPKCRQNYTMGIKLPWTLDDEENWNHNRCIFKLGMADDYDICNHGVCTNGLFLFIL